MLVFLAFTSSQAFSVLAAGSPRSPKPLSEVIPRFAPGHELTQDECSDSDDCCEFIYPGWNAAVIKHLEEHRASPHALSVPSHHSDDESDSYQDTSASVRTAYGSDNEEDGEDGDYDDESMGQMLHSDNMENISFNPDIGEFNCVDARWWEWTSRSASQANGLTGVGPYRLKCDRGHRLQRYSHVDTPLGAMIKGRCLPVDQPFPKESGKYAFPTSQEEAKEVRDIQGSAGTRDVTELGEASIMVASLRASHAALDRSSSLSRGSSGAH